MFESFKKGFGWVLGSFVGTKVIGAINDLERNWRENEQKNNESKDQESK